MTSRERFEAAMQRRQPDRPPIDYLAGPAADQRLRAHLGVETEEALLDALGADFYYLPARDLCQRESILRCWRGPALDMTETERTCPLGIRWTRGAYENKFAVDEALGGPLENATSPRDVLGHPWPSARDFDFSPLLAECERHAGRVLVGGFWAGIFGDSYRMHGFQNFLMNMALNPNLVRALVDRMTDLYLELNDAVFSTLKGRLDVWFFGNDFGAQDGLLFGQPMYEEFFAHNIARLASLAHDHGVRVMMHSCGAVKTLIPALAAAGVEILDPIQVAAADMDIAALKRDHGHQVVFHGAIDTQHVLPGGTPEEVAAHCRDTIAVLGKGGGYIFGPSQLLDRDIPVENIVAMYAAARESAGG
jgi:uroporphyrinogen decarboxylase